MNFAKYYKSHRDFQSRKYVHSSMIVEIKKNRSTQQSLQARRKNIVDCSSLLCRAIADNFNRYHSVCVCVCLRINGIASRKRNIHIVTEHLPLCFMFLCTQNTLACYAMHELPEYCMFSCADTQWHFCMHTTFKYHHSTYCGNTCHGVYYTHTHHMPVS